MSWWPGRDASLSRQAIRAWLAPAPSQVTISRRRYFGGRAAIASSSTVMWSAAVFEPALPGRSIPASGSHGVVTPAAQRAQAEPFELRLGHFPIRMARHHRLVQPQAGHARQRLIRHRDGRDRTMTGLDA